MSRTSPRPGARQATAIDAVLVRRWAHEAAQSIAEERDFLTQLDAAIGDADHGVNMDRGFGAVLVDLEAIHDAQPGELLTRIGGTLVYRVGGAAGPLYGTGFRHMGSSLGDDPVVDAERWLAAWRAGLAGIQKLGAAVEGDKTIVDAYAPAIQAFERELRSGGGLSDAARKAADAARDGTRATIPMQARKGRASYLGPRSVGHQDPGATSTALLFSAFERAARDEG